MFKSKAIWGLTLTLFIILSCAASSPLENLKRNLAQYTEYSVVLEDMREDGNFFKDYYHQYKLVYGKPKEGTEELEFETEITDWYKISKKDFEKYFNNLGMVLASKSKDGQVVDAAHPPGYQYVGDSKYGQWRRDDSGNSFWEFYGKYAFFSHMFGMFGRPIYRNDWDTYRDYRSRGTPYYGQNKEYGTNGTKTQRTNKNFFERRQQKEMAKKSRFSERVKSRTQRSRMSGVRSRSGGFGK